MKKTILKIISSFLAFVATLVLSGLVMNRGNVNTTKDMEKATLPVIYMSIGGETVNELYGYTAEMNTGLLRENITPLDENRGVTFRVEKYGRIVKGITLKVRTVDGSRLIENIDVTDYQEDDYSILATAELKDLINQGTEYSLQIYLTFSDNTEAFYHTRIIDAKNYCVREKINFVRDFVSAEMTVDSNAALKSYMESNYLGDNTTLSYVNIHSSMEQLAFGSLNVIRTDEPVINIKEIASETGIFLVNYPAKSSVNGEVKQYFVEEYFRVKYTPETIYLLDYHRTMHEAGLFDERMIRSEDILLGITDSDIGLIESEDGEVVCFVNEGTLYSYNNTDSKFARLYSFYDEDNMDTRTTRQNYKIKPLSVDEAGNVKFAVYGYMNRGIYEGKVGIGLYSFDGVSSVVEELFFISSNKSPEVVMRDIDELCYLNREGVLYLMLDKTIYAIDTENKAIETLVESLEENKYSVSDDSTLVVWQDGDDVNACTSIELMNLNTNQINTIAAPDGQYIKPLAFIGEDFVYGLSYKEDIITDSAGRTTFPMYNVKIQSKYGEVLKQYSEENRYVTQVVVKDTMLTLNRVEKAEGEELSYRGIENEYITNNQEQDALENVVDEYSFGPYEKVVRIILKKENKSKVIAINPKEVIYEGDKILNIKDSESDKKYYYVYYDGKLQAIYTNPANAVNEADLNYGTVLNENGYYVWYRANRFQRNQIMPLSLDTVGEEGVNSLAFCLDRMTEYEGIVRNSEYLLRSRNTVLDILSDALEEDDVLDLYGCSLDSVLYYVNRDIPVLAITGDKAYLVIGFNQLAIVVLDPEKGWYKIGMNEAEELFESYGNRFVTYVPNAS